MQVTITHGPCNVRAVFERVGEAVDLAAQTFFCPICGQTATLAAVTDVAVSADGTVTTTEVREGGSVTLSMRTGQGGRTINSAQTVVGQRARVGAIIQGGLHGDLTIGDMDLRRRDDER